MKVLLDECLPKKLKREVAAEVVKTVPEMGWGSIVNGALLHLAEQEFDVFLTNDQNLEHQSELEEGRFGDCGTCRKHERHSRPSTVDARC